MADTMSGRVVKSPDVLLQDLNGEAVLLNLRNGKYYGMDENSFYMYKTLISASSIQTAYESLLQEFDVTPDQLLTDLESFISTLKENDLILAEELKSE